MFVVVRTSYRQPLQCSPTRVLTVKKRTPPHTLQPRQWPREQQPRLGRHRRPSAPPSRGRSSGCVATGHGFLLGQDSVVHGGVGRLPRRTVLTASLPAGGHSSRGVAAAPAITGPFPPMAIGVRKCFRCGWVRAETARSPDRLPLVLEKQSDARGRHRGVEGPSGPRSWAELARVGGTRLQQDRAGGCHLLRMVPALTIDQDRP